MIEQTEAVSEKTEEIAPNASAPAPAVAKEVAAPELENHHVERTGWRKIFPQVVVDNATRISNAGLFMFTGIMLYSGFRGKKISQDIFDAQLKLVKEKAPMSAEALTKQVAAWTTSSVIKKPALHKLRFAYLLTAMTSFGIGAIFKRKEESPEDLERYSKMSLPDYMRTRTQEALDPTHHSRQTVGIVASASGVLAVTSALTQPGGIHKSELYVGSLLAVGGAFLAYLKNAVAAQQVFTICWMLRAPAIWTGSIESTQDFPKFKNPFVAEMKKTPEYLKGAEEALRNGHPEKIWLGLRKVHRTGPAAVKVYDQKFGDLTLPDKRMDIAYPIGQVGNFISAFIGIVGRKPAPKHVPKVEPVAVVAADDLAPAAPAAVPNPTVHTVHKAAETLQTAPERLQAALRA